MARIERRWDYSTGEIQSFIFGLTGKDSILNGMIVDADGLREINDRRKELGIAPIAVANPENMLKFRRGHG